PGGEGSRVAFLAPMDERVVTNGDIELRVEVTGSEPTILCVHGWPELSHSWRHQVAHFTERGYMVAAMDVRGYGGSSAPSEIERRVAVAGSGPTIHCVHW